MSATRTLMRPTIERNGWFILPDGRLQVMTIQNNDKDAWLEMRGRALGPNDRKLQLIGTGTPGNRAVISSVPLGHEHWYEVRVQYNDGHGGTPVLSEPIILDQWPLPAPVAPMAIERPTLRLLVAQVECAVTKLKAFVEAS